MAFILCINLTDITVVLHSVSLSHPFDDNIVTTPTPTPISLFKKGRVHTCPIVILRTVPVFVRTVYEPFVIHYVSLAQSMP